MNFPSIKNRPFAILFQEQVHTFDHPIRISEFIAHIKLPGRYQYVAGIANNKITELSAPINKDTSLKLVDLHSLDGIKIYQRSCLFLLLTAFHNRYPAVKVKVLHSLQEGPYCSIANAQLTDRMIENVLKEMNRLVKLDLPIEKKVYPTQVCRDVLLTNHHYSKYKLLKYKHSSVAKLHYLDKNVGYFLGYLAPSTKYLKLFNLKRIKNGVVLTVPSIISPTRIPRILKPIGKFYTILTEFQKWSQILGVETVGDLNEAVESGYIRDIIKISEGLQEKKIAYIADQIAHMAKRKDKKNRVRLVLISGPTSSGKTTFTKRLDIQLRVNGIRTAIIGLDHYYLNRDKIPTDSKGELDFEHIDALNLHLFNQNLTNLFKGNTIKLPSYDFATGKNTLSNETLQLGDKQVLIVEGIHGLNPQLSAAIPERMKYKIYVSALTQIRYDSTNLIPTTDIRLLRRIVRDNKYRSYNVNQTLQRWTSVRIGEERNIFPFQENADVMFNSALSYEIPILKLYADPLLRRVNEFSPEYPEVHRLLKFLAHFIPISSDDVPSTSILREFIGKSSFSY